MIQNFPTATPTKVLSIPTPPLSQAPVKSSLAHTGYTGTAENEEASTKVLVRRG